MKRTDPVRRRRRFVGLFVATLSVVTIAAACSASSSNGTDDGGASSTATQIAGDGDSDSEAGGEPQGSERDQMHTAISDWYLDEGPSKNRESADCVADAMLDSVTVADLANLGVTIETIGELYYGPLASNDDFFERLTACALRFS